MIVHTRAGEVKAPSDLSPLQKKAYGFRRTSTYRPYRALMGMSLYSERGINRPITPERIGTYNLQVLGA